MENSKLKKIYDRFNGQEYNDKTYAIGGGLSSFSSSSNRHDDAKFDEGKLTLGKTVALFKRATGESTDYINEVLMFAFKKMEWHHAGFIPAKYGGGMAKTYFLNADQICSAAENWDKFKADFEKSKIEELEKKELKRREDEERYTAYKLEEVARKKFLEENAVFMHRVSEKPVYFFQTAQEMDGKYGWFDSKGKNYKLPEFYSGWKFSEKENYNYFYQKFIYHQI